MRAESDGKGVLIRWLGRVQGGVLAYFKIPLMDTSVRPVRNKPSWGDGDAKTKESQAAARSESIAPDVLCTTLSSCAEAFQPVHCNPQAEKAMTSPSLNSWDKLLPVLAILR